MTHYAAPVNREGKIVPAEVTVGLLRKAMKESGKSRFLIDGFPRNPENLAAWERSTAGGAVVVEFTMFLDCPEEVRGSLERVAVEFLAPVFVFWEGGGGRGWGVRGGRSSGQ